RARRKAENGWTHYFPCHALHGRGIHRLSQPWLPDRARGNRLKTKMSHFLHSQAELEAALAHLIIADPRLRPVAQKAGAFQLRRREAGFAGLCAIVCGQQLSTASAAAIRDRLFAAFEPFHHDAVRLARADKLRRLGLSAPKIKSIKAIAT